MSFPRKQSTSQIIYPGPRTKPEEKPTYWAAAPTLKVKPVHPKGNQPWIFIGRTDEAETPILWPPDAKSLLTGKDPDTGKDWGQEKKGATGWDGSMASSTQWKNSGR